MHANRVLLLFVGMFYKWYNVQLKIVDATNAACLTWLWGRNWCWWVRVSLTKCSIWSYGMSSERITLRKCLIFSAYAFSIWGERSLTYFMILEKLIGTMPRLKNWLTLFQVSNQIMLLYNFISTFNTFNHKYELLFITIQWK